MTNQYAIWFVSGVCSLTHFCDDLDLSFAEVKSAIILDCLLLRFIDIMYKVTVQRGSYLDWARSSVDRATDF